MLLQSLRLAFLIGLVLHGVPLCLPEVARADDKAEVRAACTEAEALREKGDYPGAVRPTSEPRNRPRGPLVQNP